MNPDEKLLGTIPPQTKASKRDTKYGTDMGRWFLATLGVWLYSDDTHMVERVLSQMWILACYFLILFGFIPLLLYSIFIQEDLSKKIRLCAPIIFYVTTLTKYKLLIRQRNNITKCIDHMNVDFRRIKCEEDRTHMIQYARIGKIIATLSTISMYSSGTLYRLIFPLTRSIVIRPDNVTIRPLAIPIYEPLFNAHTYKSWIIIFTGQFMGGYVMYTITIVACNLASIFVLHACGQLKLVMTRLEDCVEGKNHVPDVLKDRIGEIIQLHVRSLCFILRVDRVLNKISFTEVGASTLIICVVGYDLLTCIRSHEPIVILITYSVRIISFTLNIFILCYIGETLRQQEEKVGTIAYSIDWNKLPVTNAKDIMIIIIMSRYPNSITAGKMMELSYATFCSIVKTAVAYLNVLRATTE